MAVSDYSTTPADNTSISGLTVSDSTVANTLDNIIRQMMADIKAADDANAKNADTETISGSWTFTATPTVSSATFAILDLYDTGGTSTHNRIRVQAGDGAFNIAVRDNANAFVASAYNVEVGSSGATTHSWAINGTTELGLSTSALRIGQNTTDGPATNNIAGAGISLAGAAEISRDSGPALSVNRKTDDGALVTFRQDGTLEGQITVSGTTVSYNNFLGAHYSELQGRPQDVLPGTIVEATGTLVTDRFQRSQRLTKFKVSDTPGSRAVYGAVLGPSYEEGEDRNPVRRQYQIAAVGAGHVRMSVNPAVGDLVESAGDGTGRVQADDVIRSSTVAKITSHIPVETYPDGSKLYPCVFYCG